MGQTGLAEACYRRKLVDYCHSIWDEFQRIILGDLTVTDSIAGSPVDTAKFQAVRFNSNIENDHPWSPVSLIAFVWVKSLKL
ncbi:unnamed protein product (mitochondrion) [Plasmodiophora brassicae]|uniref:Uncharacterized protein n=1 Tax=Plasmodiophora brassicae TaxID=37360 RepID=A0A3P3YAS7_PLABS|nr:unnamed protein product [Plasmodiophora brassicae]